MLRRTALLTALLCLATQTAQAHTGSHDLVPWGLGAGFLHPLSGLDHVLAMVAVGMLAAPRGGGVQWSLPATFMGMMALGGVAGTLMPLPFVEMGITGSVVILGGVLAVGQRLSSVTALLLVGLLALFHGHAHGSEIPAQAHGLLHGAGFILATALLHA
ncbi:MAG: HupE/UreJ family protein, partial [Magnetococcus sp. WYHC-3]